MIEQDFPDLIYAIIKQPIWVPVPHISGGIYDRCMNNFKSHRQDPILTGNEEYQWARIPASAYIRNVVLARPGKTVRLKTTQETDKQTIIHNFRWTNVVIINLLLYRSITHKNIQGFTFGDRTNILKPLKMLDHQWTKEIWGSNVWKCDVCGIKGTSHHSNESAIIPDKFLTCDEAIIEGIIT